MDKEKEEKRKTLNQQIPTQQLNQLH